MKSSLSRPGLVQRVVELGEVDPRLLLAVGAGGDPAVAQLCRPAQRDGGVAAADERHRFGGRGLHLAFGDVVEVAVELDPAAAPERAQGDDHFVEALAAGGEVLSRQVELLLAPADADAEPRAGCFDSTAVVPTLLATVMRSRSGAM